MAEEPSNPIFVPKDQRQRLTEQAKALVYERFEQLSALSNKELLELKQTTQGIELDGIRMTLLTHTPHRQHPAFGVLVFTEGVRMWRWWPFYRPRWHLAHRAFWFKNGERIPFEEEDYW